MKKHVTLFDICKRAGVSSATVSRVMNQSPLVVEPTRKKVLKAIRDLGYHPSHAARMLARQRTDTIAVIFPEIAGGFFAEVLAGIDAAAAEHRYHVITALSHGAEDEKNLISRFALERRADGLIVMALTSGLDPLIKQTGKRGLPMVVIGRPVSGPNIFSISMDNQGGAGLALEHLAERGCRRIALITGPADNYDAQQRMEGSRKAAARLGLEIPPSLIWPGTFKEEGGRAAVEKYLRSGSPLPQAIFAFNDETALGARAALLERGHRVPEDVALVGFDNLDSARHVELTTLHNPMREIGRAAGEGVLQKIGDASTELAHRVLPVKLIARASTAAQKTASA